MGLPATKDDAPVAQILTRGAEELDRLAVDAQRLHALIERQLEIAGLPDAALEDAQLIDFLVQHLEALGAYLRLLAGQVPTHVTIDLARLAGRLTLSDLDRRLAGEDRREPGPAAGDLDLW